MIKHSAGCRIKCRINAGSIALKPFPVLDMSEMLDFYRL